MTATPRPWVVERHDQDDGTINYEIWCQTAPHYHRVVTLNDYDNEHAREDAELIVRAVNAPEQAIEVCDRRYNDAATIAANLRNAGERRAASLADAAAREASLIAHEIRAEPPQEPKP